MIIIRIWHYQLLPYLPDAQFKGQLRELVAIMHDWRDKGKTNHLLINKVMEYPKAELTFYFDLYYRRYYERYGVNIKFPIYQEFVDFGCEEIDKCSGIPLFAGWHNDTYLNICMYNLLEKHLGVGKSRVTDKEWARLCEGYKKITGHKFHDISNFEPVIHAHWKLKESTQEFSEQICTCTNCGYPLSRWYKTKRCPECGAHMDEV